MPSARRRPAAASASVRIISATSGSMLRASAVRSTSRTSHSGTLCRRRALVYAADEHHVTEVGLRAAAQLEADQRGDRVGVAQVDALVVDDHRGVTRGARRRR